MQRRAVTEQGVQIAYPDEMDLDPNQLGAKMKIVAPTYWTSVPIPAEVARAAALSRAPPLKVDIDAMDISSSDAPDMGIASSPPSTSQMRLFAPEELSNEARLKLALQLVNTLPRHLKACAADYIKTLLYTNFISELPTELAVHILSMVGSHRALNNARLVSKRWHELANDNEVWRAVYFSYSSGTHLMNISHYLDWRIPIPKSLFARYDKATALWYSERVRGQGTASGSIDWRELYSQHFQLQNNWRRGRCDRKVLEGHAGAIYCMQFDQHRVITGGRDHMVKIWSWPSMELLQTLAAHTGSVLCLQFESDNRNSEASSVTLDSARVEDWKEKSDEGDSPSKSTNNGSSCNNNLLLSKFQEFVQAVKGGKQVTSAMMPCQARLVTGSSDFTIRVWHWPTGTCLMVLRGHEDSVLNLRVHDGRIFSCSKDNTVRIWTLDQGSLLRVLRGHSAAVNAMAVGDNWLVSGSGDRTMRLWDLQTGATLRVFEGHQRGVACLACDGKIIVTGSSDKTLRVWDMNTGTCRLTMLGHEDLVRSLQFDDTRIISGSYDRTIRIWDLKTGECIQELSNDLPESRVFKLQFDTTKIISCTQDNKIVIWDFTKGIQPPVLLCQYEDTTIFDVNRRS